MYRELIPRLLTRGTQSVLECRDRTVMVLLVYWYYCIFSSPSAVNLIYKQIPSIRTHEADVLITFTFTHPDVARVQSRNPSRAARRGEAFENKCLDTRRRAP